MSIQQMPETEDAPLESAGETMIRERIEHTLKIYPKLSMSMLQVSIGTGLSPALWHPVLDRMIEDGVVDKQTFACPTPRGRQQTYIVISLKQAA